MPSTNRRLFLGTLGATLTGIAGCLGDSTADMPTQTLTEIPSRETTKSTSTATNESSNSFSLPDSTVKAVGDTQVVVANLTVEKAVLYSSIMGSGGVLAPDGKQFVVAAVQSGGGSTVNAEPDPSCDSFELVSDGEVYSTVEIEDRTTGAYTTSLAERGKVRYDEPYASGRSVGWVEFEPPLPLDVRGAAIRCQHGGETAEWPLSGEQVEALARPTPTFELRSFETAVRSVSVKLSLVGENVSKVDGQFLAAVYWPTTGIADDDESTIVSRSIGPGERIEWTKSFGTAYTGGENGTVTARIEDVVSSDRTVDIGE